MATPISSFSHGSTLPETTATHQDYRQQYHDRRYEPGLTPGVYQGKEVVTSPSPHQQGHSYSHLQQGASGSPPEKRICGLRKITFILTFLIAFLLAGAIGAGVAAGVIASQKNGGGSSSSGGSSSPSSSPNPSATPSASTSTRSPNAAFTAIPLPEPVAGSRGTPKCPDTDLHETPINGTDLIFKHYCGLDYTSNDLAYMPMTNMEDCIALCAAQNIRPQGLMPCVGVSWVYGGKQGSGLSYCWLKTKKSDPTAKDDVESAWLQDYWD